MNLSSTCFKYLKLVPLPADAAVWPSMDERCPFLCDFIDESAGVCGRIADVTVADEGVVNVTFLRTAVSCRAVDDRFAASTSLCEAADLS